MFDSVLQSIVGDWGLGWQGMDPPRCSCKGRPLSPIRGNFDEWAPHNPPRRRTDGSGRGEISGWVPAARNWFGILRTANQSVLCAVGSLELDESREYGLNLSSEVTAPVPKLATLSYTCFEEIQTT